MKAIVLSLIIILIPLVGKTQVYFKNNYNEPVWVTLGYYIDTKSYKGWVTKGWFKIAPGEKTEILSYNTTTQYLYYYAETRNSNRKFAGNTTFLVNPKNQFYIKNADKEYVKKENPIYKWYKFRTVNKGGIDIWKTKYTIDFGG